MAKKKNPTVGDRVHIIFWDHAENSPDALKFELYGAISSITSRAYIVRCWGYVNDVDRAADANTDNETTYAIVKKAVESIEILK